MISKLTKKWKSKLDVNSTSITVGRKGGLGRYSEQRSGMPQIYMNHVKKWKMKINLVNELSVMKINICYREQVNDIKNFRRGRMDSRY